MTPYEYMRYPFRSPSDAQELDLRLMILGDMVLKDAYPVSRMSVAVSQACGRLTIGKTAEVPGGVRDHGYRSHLRPIGCGDMNHINRSLLNWTIRDTTKSLVTDFGVGIYVTEHHLMLAVDISEIDPEMTRLAHYGDESLAFDSSVDYVPFMDMTDVRRSMRILNDLAESEITPFDAFLGLKTYI